MQRALTRDRFLVAVACLAGCGEMDASRRLPYALVGGWEVMDSLRIQRRDSTPVDVVAALALDSDRLLLSDARGAQLGIYSVQAPYFEPLPGPVFRPGPPTILARWDDTLVLVGRPLRELAFIHIGSGGRIAATLPRAPGWGAVPVGQFGVVAPHEVLMVPWANSLGYPVRTTAQPPPPGLLLIDPVAGVVVGGVGTTPANLHRDYLASLDHAVEVAGIWGDSAVVVDLSRAIVGLYDLKRREYLPAREVDLGQAFVPACGWFHELPGGFVEVATQPQLVDVLATRSRMLAVLRNRSFSWTRRGTIRRNPGDWYAENVIELYDAQGRRVLDAALPRGRWLGLFLTTDERCVGVFSLRGRSEGTRVSVRLFPILSGAARC